MAAYCKYNKNELQALHADLEKQYREVQAENLSLDMSRGKPSTNQIRLSEGLLTAVHTFDQLIEDGKDLGNYGVPQGIYEARQLVSDMLDAPVEEVVVGGNSSLNLMHDIVSYLYNFGVPDGTPWKELEEVKFLCPVPGYDRHFAISQHFGFTLIPVEMDDHGPNMDMVEELVKDPAVKGMWSVPKYSNPSGITYSADVVLRLARMKTGASDFRIFWDNAYVVHHLDWEHPDELLDLRQLAKEYGHPHRVFEVCSTSKVTFPGGGISGLATSPENIQWYLSHMGYQTIGYDKINQLRHACFLPNREALVKHMKAQVDHLAPKFQIVLDGLAPLRPLGIADWQEPKGGYFISLQVLDGCAKRIVQLCKEAGVAMTPAGATHPYGEDPKDNTIRIAPTWPPEEDLRQAVTLLNLAVRLASVEYYLQQLQAA